MYLIAAPRGRKSDTGGRKGELPGAAGGSDGCSY